MVVSRPGQYEKTTTSEQSELWTPLKIAVISAFAVDILLIVIHIFVVLVFWRLADWKWRGLENWFAWYADWGLLATFIIPIFLPWPVAVFILVVYRYIPELQNRNWPPVYNPLDPSVGFVTARTKMPQKSSIDQTYSEVHLNMDLDAKQGQKQEVELYLDVKKKPQSSAQVNIKERQD